MRLSFTLAVALLLIAAGCQHTKPPDQKAEAQKNWNDARSTILYSLAEDQYKAHDYDKCLETLEKAMKMTPEAPLLHALAAKVDIEQGKAELAEKELELARKFGPNEPEPYYLSGVIYQRWQKPLTALEFYRDASQRAPAELQYILAEGEMLVALNRIPDALALLQAKVAYFENSGTIRDAVGQLLVQSGRYAEAVDMFREASILSEDNDGIRERLANACFLCKQYRESAQVLSQLTEKDPYSKRADLFAMLGECRFNLNDTHGAKLAFEMATELNSLSARYWQGLGRAELEGGDLRGAELALRRSIGVDPSLSETHLLLGYARLREGKFSEALTSFRQANRLDGSDTVSLCMIGYTCEKMGRRDEAADCYARALRIRPDDDMAKQLMAQIDK